MEKTEYEFINFSDPYTFLASDLEVAAIVVFLMGAAYGAKSKDGSKQVPIFLFGGEPEAWYRDQFGRSPSEGYEALALDVADALESFMLGDFTERERYQAALDAIDDSDKKKQFMAKWQDSCSSLNDIGTRAHHLGEAIRDKVASSEKN